MGDGFVDGGLEAEGDQRLAAVWQVLSALLLQPPDTDVLATVQNSQWLAEWPLPLTAPTREALALLAHPVDALEAADDHRQLFVGPSRNPVPPWESVHRTEDRLLFDDVTFAVRQAYADSGLQAPRLNREPDDHIGLELDFCATLLRSGHREEHDRFCVEHLLRWAPGFAEQVVDRAETSFYRGVGMLLAEALAVASRGLDPAS